MSNVPMPPDALILCIKLEAAARCGLPAEAPYFYDTVRCIVGDNRRVWFTINNGPRLYRARCIEMLDQIERTEQRRAALIAESQR